MPCGCGSCYNIALTLTLTLTREYFALSSTQCFLVDFYSTDVYSGTTSVLNDCLTKAALSSEYLVARHPILTTYDTSSNAVLKMFSSFLLKNVKISVY